MRRNVMYWLLLIVIVAGVIGYIVLSFADAPPEPITAGDMIATVPAQTTGAGEFTPPATFEVVRDESVALFRAEYWALSRQTATGETRDITGTVTVDAGDDAVTIDGTIRVDLRLLDTRNAQIDRVMHNDILQTDTHAYADFTPQTVDGLPVSLPLGVDVPFAMTGDLTLRDITRPVTFEAVLRLTSPEQVVISGVTSVERTLFDLTAPEPFGSNIGDLVTIAFRFVGTTGENS